MSVRQRVFRILNRQHICLLFNLSSTEPSENKKYSPDKDFSNWGFMILSFVPENPFKFTANTLPMGTVWVRFECNLAKGKGNMK